MKTIRNVIHIFLLFALVNVFQAASAQQVGAGAVAAVPTGVDFGDAGTLGTIRVAVVRGFSMTPVFAIAVTSMDPNPANFAACTIFFSDAVTFGFAKSNAVIGVPFDDPSICPDSAGTGISAGASLDVCAKVLFFQGGEYVDFSQEVCVTLDPR